MLKSGFKNRKQQCRRQGLSKEEVYIESELWPGCVSIVVSWVEEPLKTKVG